MFSLPSSSETVLTLDAGGTNLKFSAIQNYRVLFDPLYIPTDSSDLTRCLTSIAYGFAEIKKLLPAPPSAISFAFPGPADYPRGIIGDLPNLPVFRGGVALGPYLEDIFRIPVFINNDGDLFAYGESIAGFLPEVNARLAEANNPQRFKNLLGVTIGTGFGGGIVIDGHLLSGDNSAGGEIWLSRNKLNPESYVDSGCSIQAIRRTYAELSGFSLAEVPTPKEIAAIANGEMPGDMTAARQAFRQLGEIAGEAIAQAITLIDGLVVIGGGISGAASLFLPFLLAAMNSSYDRPEGPLRRLIPHAYNYENPDDRSRFLNKKTVKTISVPGSSREVFYDSEKSTAIGISRLGTSQAVSIGAYAFALQKL